jgi:hypothetical protein
MESAILNLIVFLRSGTDNVEISGDRSVNWPRKAAEEEGVTISVAAKPGGGTPNSGTKA